MSLKSFDKFCEDLILKQPGSDKAVLDERQKLMRSKILTETFVIYACLSFANTLFMDLAYRWSETFAAPMLIFMLMCAFYYNVRCACTGSLVGINGERSAKMSAWYCVLMGFMMFMRFIFSDDKALVKDGRLTDNCCFMIVYILAVVIGISTFVFVKVSRRSNKEDEQ